MIPEFEGLIAFRLSIEDRQQIEQLIKEGKYKSLSQAVRAALADFLAKGDKLCQAPSA